MNRTLCGRLVVLLGATLLCTAVSVTVIGAEDPPNGAGPTGARTDTVAVGGVVLRIERETGRLQPPTSEQVRQLRAVVQQLYAPTREASEVVTVGGMTSVVLDERYAVFSVARIDELGRLTTHCVSGAANAEKALDAQRSSADAREE